MGNYAEGSRKDREDHRFDMLNSNMTESCKKIEENLKEMMEQNQLIEKKRKNTRTIRKQFM